MNKLPLESQWPRRRLVSGVFLVIWSVKLIFGLVDIAERHVPSYPDAIRGSPDIGQLGFYVAIPVAFVTFNLLMLVFANKLRRWLEFIVAILQILALPILLLIGAGGV